MTALTNAQKQKAHRRRMADKMARYEKALRDIEQTRIWDNKSSLTMRQIAQEALNPTDLNR